MAQLLRALAALAEDRGSVSSAYMVAHNCLPFHFQGLQHPFLTSMDTNNTHGTHTYMQAKHPLHTKKF